VHTMLNRGSPSLTRLMTCSLLALVLALSAGTVLAVVDETEKAATLAEPDITGSLIQTTLGLLFIVLLIFGAAWAVKRFGGLNMGAQGHLKVVGGVSLGQRERAVLLQVGDKQLVVGVAQGHIQTLHVLDEPLPIDAGSATGVSFAERLQGAISARQRKSADGTGNIDEDDVNRGGRK